MKRISIILLVVVLFSFQTDKHFIYWEDNRPLKWSDFKKEQRGDLPAGAIANVASNMNHNSWKEKDHYLFRVRAFFRTDGSYSIYKDDDNEDTYSLRHEQYHFNITEVYARKVRKDLTDSIHLLAKMDENTYCNHFFMKYYWQQSNAQKACDKETKGGNDTLQQKHWEQMVDEELIKLAAYKNTEIKVTFCEVKKAAESNKGKTEK